MTRRVEVIKLDEGYLVKAWAKTAAEAERLQFACVGVPVAEAFMPIQVTYAPKLGIPFDPPEEWPSDKTAKTVGEVGDFVTMPPPCDGNNSAGQYIATAQLEDALTSDGDGCGVGLCVKRDEA